MSEIGGLGLLDSVGPKINLSLGPKINLGPLGFKQLF